MEFDNSHSTSLTAFRQPLIVGVRPIRRPSASNSGGLARARVLSSWDGRLLDKGGALKLLDSGFPYFRGRRLRIGCAKSGWPLLPSGPNSAKNDLSAKFG